DIRYRLRGIRVKPVVCTEDDFQHFMETIYATKQEELSEAGDALADQTFIESEVDLSTLDVLAESEEEINDLDLAKQAQDAPIV
ncbi:hypothetical protein ABTB06_20120, partial [Acinetobacter baumannii]